MARGMGSTYQTCAEHCAAQEGALSCSGAWKERNENCEVRYDLTCQTLVKFTSDAICECAAPSAAVPASVSPEMTASVSATESMVSQSAVGLNDKTLAPAPGPDVSCALYEGSWEVPVFCNEDWLGLHHLR